MYLLDTINIWWYNTSATPQIYGVSTKGGKMANGIKQRREELHLTQKQVAEKAELRESQFQLYEYDKTLPSVATALRIAQALDTTVESLYKHLLK